MTNTATLLKEYAPDLTQDEKFHFHNQYISRRKNKSTGVVLALLTGGLGGHQFWLGYSGRGVIYLLCSTVGWIVILPPLVVMVQCLIDAAQMGDLVAKRNRSIAKRIFSEVEALR